MHIRESLNEFNCIELPPETFMGKLNPINPQTPWPLITLTDDGKDVAAEYFHVVNNQLVLAKPAIFCMSSMDERIIQQDCLGYLMERIKRESLLNIEI